MNNKTNNILAIAGLTSSLAAYQLWKLLWDDFCYQALGLALLFLFALCYNLGKHIFWVRKTTLIGIGISLYNLFDEWFLSPMHCYKMEYYNFGLIVFFIFLPEILVLLRHIQTVFLDCYYKVQLYTALKTLVNGPDDHNKVVRNNEKQKRWLGRRTGINIAFNFMFRRPDKREPEG